MKQHEMAIKVLDKVILNLTKSQIETLKAKIIDAESEMKK